MKEINIEFYEINKNDRKSDSNNEPSISLKQVTTLKSRVASKAYEIVSNGYSSYHRNFQKSSSNFQSIRSEINSNTSLKSKVANSIKQRARFSKLQKSQSKKHVKSTSNDKDVDGKKHKFGRKRKKIYFLNESKIFLSLLYRTFTSFGFNITFIFLSEIE